MALIALVWMMLPGTASAEYVSNTLPQFWTVPAIYAFDEEVTWYFDVSGLGFEEGLDLYLWAWEPSEPDAGNRDNSSDFAKLEYVGKGIYKKTLIPTVYFNCDLAKFNDFPGFWMQLKEKHDGLCTKEFAMSDPRQTLKEFKESGKANMFYPQQFGNNDEVTILVNASVLTANDLPFTGQEFESIHLVSGLNGWDHKVDGEMYKPEIVEKTRLSSLGDGLYKISLIPTDYWGIDEFYEMETIQYFFISHNPDWGLKSPDDEYKVDATALTPEFFFFPQQFTQHDILTLIRINNEKSSRGLEYTITAGSKTITGEFEGTLAERLAHVNLLKELAGENGVDKITVKVSHKNGAEIVNTTIPLVSLSEVE